MSGTPKQAAPVATGLRVEQSHTGKGWVIRHEPSGVDCGIWLRLKRQAEDAMTELLAAGEDFTQAHPQIMDKALQHRAEALAVVAVLARWRDRAQHCCDGDEHYDPLTYAMNGRCTGPLSNGKPRRS